MKKWTNPEINSIKLDSTELLNTVRINVGNLEPGRIEDIYTVLSEGSPDDPIEIPS